MPFSVLIADDQREVIRALKSGLETLTEDVVVWGVMSGEEALLEARFKRIDLLISNVRLPGMTGFELVQRIRMANPELKTILLAAATSQEIRREVEKAGADTFYVKPINQADFLDTCERLMGLTKPGAMTPAGVIPPQGVVAPTPETGTPGKGVSERLLSLRQNLGALSVILLSDNGQVVVRAGDLPEPGIETMLIPSLMAAFSTGQKISQFLRKSSPQNFQIYHGAVYDLVFSPIGNTYALLTITNGDLLGINLGSIIEKIRLAISELSTTLERMGVSLTTDENIQVLPFLTEVDTLTEMAAEEVDPDLEALLNLETGPQMAGDLDQFWEATDDQSGAGNLNADALSYEQALQLGLAPEDE